MRMDPTSIYRIRQKEFRQKGKDHRIPWLDTRAAICCELPFLCQHLLRRISGVLYLDTASNLTIFSIAKQTAPIRDTGV